MPRKRRRNGGFSEEADADPRSTRALLLELHQAVVGSPDGKVKGLRPMAEAVELRHAAVDEEKRARRWRSWVIETGRWAGAGIATALGIHLGSTK